jgi:hypothetical protein
MLKKKTLWKSPIMAKTYENVGSVEKQPETIGDNSSYEAGGPACTMEGKSEAFRVNGSLHLDSNRTNRTSGPHHF